MWSHMAEMYPKDQVQAQRPPPNGGLLHRHQVLYRKSPSLGVADFVESFPQPFLLPHNHFRNLHRNYWFMVS